MQALQALGTGLSAVSCVEQAELPPPAPKHVTLEVLLAVINPADLLTLEGKYGIEPEPPFVPGAECLARVLALGDSVEGLSVGDLVIPFGGACWQTHVACHAGALVKLPAEVDPFQAAMLKANPATALAMLRDIEALEPGDWVAQNAGNSAVGLNVIKIAKQLGLKTVSIVRREAAVEALRAAGADHVLVDANCTPEPVAGIEAKLAFDAVGGKATAALARMLAPKGRIANYGLLSGNACEIEPHDLVFRGVSLQGFWLAEWFQTAGRAKIASHYAELLKWLAEGHIGAPVAQVYPLKDFAKAISHAAKAGRDGKILIEMPAFKERF